MQAPFLVASQASARLLRLVDDRGRSVTEPLQVCFQVDLQPDCRTAAPGAPIPAPPHFQSLWVEGANLGPVRRERENLALQKDGSWSLALPRKARLRWASTPAKTISVALYDPADGSFRRPLFRGALGPEGGKVPAGSFIASLTTPGHAPDLQRLTILPASEIRLRYRPLPGWSLLLRCLASPSGKVVAGAKASLTEIRGYGQPPREKGLAVGDEGGLVLFSGVTGALAAVTLEHPAFAPTSALGLTASPGTFAFQEVALTVPARLAAHVTIAGQPPRDATCQLLQSGPADPKAKRSPPVVRASGPIGADGRCRFDRLAPGLYKLRVAMPRGKSEVSRWLSLAPGEDRLEEVGLLPAHVRGEVHLGEAPATGYSVRTFEVDAYRPEGELADDAAIAAVDEAGKYELSVWEPGWYSFSAWTPAGTPSAGHKELTLRAGDDERLDFQLGTSSFHGVVVDGAGHSVEGATVSLRWQGLMTTTTDAAGRFEIHVDGEGPGTLQARKNGYAPSEPQTTEMKLDTAIPAVVLTLQKTSTVTGTVVAAGAVAVPGAWVASTAFSPEAGARLYRAAQTGADGRFEIEVPPGQTSTLFASGPGCPLSGTAAPLAATGDTAPEGAPALVLQCPAQPAALDLTFVDENGRAVANAGVILRQAGTVVPQAVLGTHLALLGLPSTADGNGRLVLPYLAPGDYDLFLAGLSSESTMAAGSAQGFLEKASLAPSTTTELQITVRSSVPGAAPVVERQR